MTSVIRVVDYIGYYGPVILFATTFYCLLNRIPYLIAFTGGSILNTFANEVLKNTFREPRPPNQIAFIDDKNLTGTHFYGLPSGHAQASAFAIAFLILVNGPETLLYFMTCIFITTLYQRWKYHRHSIKQLAAGSLIGALMAWIIVFMTQYYLYGYKHHWSLI
jgi:membrane-associated phospholipid phosphatase